MALPTLIVVSGPPGSGKSTLAHLLARNVGCPAILRDEIKEGMVNATPEFVPAPSDPLTLRTNPVFFGVLDLLLRAGVTVVAEAAFQDKVWRPNLEPLSDLAEFRIVQCRVDAAVARERITSRAADNAVHRAAHPAIDRSKERAGGPSLHDSFDPITLSVPTLTVDTTDGYVPPMSDLVAFINDRAGQVSRESS